MLVVSIPSNSVLHGRFQFISDVSRVFLLRGQRLRSERFPLAGLYGRGILEIGHLADGILTRI